MVKIAPPVEVMGDDGDADEESDATFCGRLDRGLGLSQIAAHAFS